MARTLDFFRRPSSIQKPLALALVLTSISLLSACNQAEDSTETVQDSNARTSDQKPKNVILMIGDGMGFSYLKAHRIFQDDPATPLIEQTAFDQLLTGSVATDSAHEVGAVTDSAAAATTYATGYKTHNGAVGVDKNDQILVTTVEVAKANKLRTGLVSTSHVNHATPAAFIAHVPKRSMYTEIADMFFDNQRDGRPQVDVILGGGQQYFKREDRDLVAEFQAADYQYLDNKSSLKKADNDKLLGLFAPKGLAAGWDRDDNTPSLTDLTDLALKTLNRGDQGFFLMVEGSQIDWAGHGNDILYLLSEMEDFEQAVKRVMAFVDENPDTLLVITADHETGGLSTGADGHYGWDVNLLRSIHSTPASLAKKIVDKEDPAASFAALTNIAVSDEEKAAIVASGNDPRALTEVLIDIINRASYTGWTSSGHTGVDVPLMVYGRGGKAFKGHIDNTLIGKKLIEFVQ